MCAAQAVPHILVRDATHTCTGLGRGERPPRARRGVAGRAQESPARHPRKSARADAVHMRTQGEESHEKIRSSKDGEQGTARQSGRHRQLLTPVLQGSQLDEPPHQSPYWCTGPSWPKHGLNFCNRTKLLRPMLEASGLRRSGRGEGRKYSDYWRLANPLFDDPKHSVVFLRKANDLRAPGQAAQSQGARSCPAADSEPLGERAASCVVVEVGSKNVCWDC